MPFGRRRRFARRQRKLREREPTHFGAHPLLPRRQIDDFKEIALRVAQHQPLNAHSQFVDHLRWRSTLRFHNANRGRCRLRFDHDELGHRARRKISRHKVLLFTPYQIASRVFHAGTGNRAVFNWINCGFRREGQAPRRCKTGIIRLPGPGDRCFAPLVQLGVASQSHTSPEPVANHRK